MTSTCTTCALHLASRFEEIAARLHEQPQTTEETDALDKFVSGLEGELASIAASMEEASKAAAVLENGRHALSDECCELYWRLRHWPVSLERSWLWHAQYAVSACAILGLHWHHLCQQHAMAHLHTCSVCFGRIVD